MKLTTNKIKRIRQQTNVNNLVYLLNRLYNLADTLDIDNSNYGIIATNVKNNTGTFAQVKARVEINQYCRIRDYDVIKVADLLSTIKCFNMDIVHTHSKNIDKYVKFITKNINSIIDNIHLQNFDNLCHQFVTNTKHQITSLIECLNPKFSFNITKSMK